MITIVSGLPRTGTSLMMQMLEAGGMPALTDEVRGADEDNPKGYYELEAVKRTRSDASWLGEAAGKVVKMVHLLLYELPADRSYHLVFMKRDLREVVRSQSLMLQRRDAAGADLTEDRLIKAYEGQLAKIGAWLGGRPNFKVLYVDYNDLMADPVPEAEAVGRFLGGGLDVAAMSTRVDRSLYRQRGRPPR